MQGLRALLMRNRLPCTPLGTRTPEHGSPEAVAEPVLHPRRRMGRATGRISTTSVSLEARFFQEPCKEIPKLPSFKSLTLELEK